MDIFKIPSQEYPFEIAEGHRQQLVQALCNTAHAHCVTVPSHKQGKQKAVERDKSLLLLGLCIITYTGLMLISY